LKAFSLFFQGVKNMSPSLTLFPLAMSSWKETHIDEDTLMSTPVSTIQISVDLEHRGDANHQERRKKWLASFKKCSHSTTLSLEFPLRFDLHQGLAGFGGMENFDADKYQKAMGAELPPPKSPSMQIQAHTIVVNEGEVISRSRRGKKGIGGLSGSRKCT
jgi:hypothetical protein